jgi:hypothetical protein
MCPIPNKIPDNTIDDHITADVKFPERDAQIHAINVINPQNAI